MIFHLVRRPALVVGCRACTAHSKQESTDRKNSRKLDQRRTPNLHTVLPISGWYETISCRPQTR